MVGACYIRVRGPADDSEYIGSRTAKSVEYHLDLLSRLAVSCVASKFDESSLSMEILIWASSRWLKTMIKPTGSVDSGQ